MKPFVRHTGIAAPLLRDNVDTDAIIPSREMKRVSKRGLGEALFAGWRYRTGREPDPQFVLNRPEYAGASVLLAGANFGCGSSREHAVWALAEFGIRAVIAQGFATIFRNNCVRNGLLPVVLPADAIQAIAGWVESDPQDRLLTVDLESCRVTAGDAEYEFTLDPAQRDMLLKGLDPIDLTLTRLPEIQAWRKADRTARPWAYPDSE